MTMRLGFLFSVVFGLPVATSHIISGKPSIDTALVFSRRNMLFQTTLLGGTAFGTQFSKPAEAAAKVRGADAELIKTTSDGYHSALADKDRFVADLASDDASAPSPLPPQIPAIMFQKLAKVAHGVDGKMDADDFQFVAIEYAEHAGAARDFARLSRLGRIGENGSAEVALDYAKRCLIELEEASVVLDTLCQAIDL